MLELSSITKTIREGNVIERDLFTNLSLTLDAQATSVAILGRSGSGKSTLLRILAGLDCLYAGEYRFNGQVVARTETAASEFRFHNVGYITQDVTLLNDRSVTENVRLGIGPKRGRTQSDRSSSERLLDMVGLPGYGERRPASLSGGEAQRVAIARALMKQPKLVLADEPTGALDEESERIVLALFESTRSHNTQYVIATHSERVAAACDLAFIIDDGKLEDWRSRTL